MSQKVTVFRERDFKEITKKAGQGAIHMHSALRRWRQGDWSPRAAKIEGSLSQNNKK